MKNRRQISSDRISALPEDITAKIVSHMPIRDALRTSILSKKWRYCWRRMPKLVFEDNLVNVSSNIQEIKKYKLVNAIFHVLLLHRALILEIHIIVVDANIANEMDQIISHLSWRNSIKEIILDLSPINEYKLPCSFFSFQGLEHLDLTNCEFELPVKFNGFSMLKSLIFEDVNITTNMLQRFLINCPLLEEFILMGYHKKEFVGKKCTILKLFKCLPSVRVVKMTHLYMKHFAAGGTRQKLPTSLVHLRGLELDVCFQNQDEVSSTLCVIGSSPNLEKIEIKMVHYVGQRSTDLLDPRDYSGLNLDHLEELGVTSFHNYATEIEFVKLIMSKSPVLKKARIELSKHVSVDQENKMLRDLLYMPFPRASPAAKFIIERHSKLPASAN